MSLRDNVGEKKRGVPACQCNLCSLLRSAVGKTQFSEQLRTNSLVDIPEKVEVDYIRSFI